MEREASPSPTPDAQLEPSFPTLPEIEVRTGRKLERHFSLEEEGITFNDIDSLGTFKGFVIQVPAEKKKIKGFFYIPRTVQGIPDLYAHSESGIETRNYNTDAAFLGLAEIVNHFTNIEEKVEPPINLSSPDIIRYPIVYISSASNYAFEMSPSCIRNLGEYLHKGGFLIVDNGCPWYEYSPAKASLLNILLQAAGKDGRFEPIPADQNIFNCFFDLPAKLPDGDEHTVIPLKKKHQYSATETLPPNWFGELLHIPELEDLRQRISTRRDSLWGLWFGERLAAVYLDKGYGHTWRDGLHAYQYRDKRPTMELGVNIVVFALIQRGGIAKQYVDYTAEGTIPLGQKRNGEGETTMKRHLCSSRFYPAHTAIRSDFEASNFPILNASWSGNNE